MRPALAYTPGRSPLHRASLGAALAFIGALMLVAFTYANPLVLIADGAAVVLAGLAAGARRAVFAALRLAGPLLLLMIAVNALVYHRGETILLRGWEVPVLGQTDVTLESLFAGASIGLRVVVAVLAFSVYSSCIDPDRVLRAIRPLARRSALTAALVVRMVPVAAGDAARIREAADLRGPAAEPVGRAALARRLVEGSLDRAIDVASTLELRGHSLGIRPVPSRERAAPGGLLLVAAAGIAAAAIAGLAVGAGGFQWYPRIEVEIDAATLALCAALPPLALLPFAGGRDA
jgi:energy-coupling factor transporter transmembrane protein EcfT